MNVNNDYIRQDANVTIVLICSGDGSNSKSYRPNRDESQWWGRRDALVRCVTSALFSNNHKSVQLILLFDGDGSMMVMNRVFDHDSQENNEFTSVDDREDKKRRKVMKKTEWTPSEMNIITSWREACIHHDKQSLSSPDLNNNKIVYSQVKPKSQKSLKNNIINNLSVKLVRLSKVINSNAQQNTNDSKLNIIPTKGDIKLLNSKREVLMHIQKHCSFDFIKSARLNASTDVIMKKYNRGKLQNTWFEWCKQAQNQTEMIKVAKKRKSTDINNNSIPEEYFQCILSLIATHSGSKTQPCQVEQKGRNSVIAAFLHESCGSELPVSLHKHNSTCSDDATKVVLFMGAVRDMSEQEHNNLASVCRGMNIPLIGCRLGPVAEFTSKILQVLTFHAASETLIPAIRRRCQDTEVGVLRVKDTISKDIIPRKNTLHFVVNVPITSNMLSSKLTERSRIVWEIVRITVCSLWRSRVASTRLVPPGAMNSSETTRVSTCNLDNLLTLVFKDGLLLTISQSTIVDVLAVKHQAAPSEYQVLVALCMLRDKASVSSNLMINEEQTEASWKTSFNSLWSSGRTNSSIIYAVDLTCCDSNSKLKTIVESNLMKTFYSGFQCMNCYRKDSCNGTAFVLLSLYHDTGHTSKIQQIMKQSLKEASIPIKSDNLVSCDVVDFASTAVTMLQHLVYQRYLFCYLCK